MASWKHSFHYDGRNIMAFTTVALTVHDVICSILDPSTPSTGALRNTCLIMICVASNFFRSQSWIDSAILSWLLILYVMTGYWFMWSDDVYCPLHTLLLLVFMLSGFKLFVSITMLLILYICVLVCICNISLNDDFHSHFDWNSNAQVFVIVFVGLCSHLSTGLVVWNLDRALENDVSNYLADISLVLSGHENVEEWERVVFPSMERVHRNSHDCKRLKTRTATGSPASVVSAHSTLDELTARAHNSLGDGGSVQLLWPMWHFGGNFGSFGCAASAPASKDTQQLDHCFRLCLRSQCTLPDSLPVSGPPKRRQARDALRSWWGRVRNAEWVSPNISLVRVPSATFPIVTMPPVSRFTKRFMNLDLEAHFWYWMRHCYASHVSDSVGTFRGLLVVKNFLFECAINALISFHAPSIVAGLSPQSKRHFNSLLQFLWVWTVISAAILSTFRLSTSQQRIAHAEHMIAKATSAVRQAVVFTIPGSIPPQLLQLAVGLIASQRTFLDVSCPSCSIGRSLWPSFFVDLITAALMAALGPAASTRKVGLYYLAWADSGMAFYMMCYRLDALRQVFFRMVFPYTTYLFSLYQRSLRDQISHDIAKR